MNQLEKKFQDETRNPAGEVRVGFMANGDLARGETPFGKSLLVVSGKEGKELRGVKDLLIDVRGTASKKSRLFHP